MNNSKTKYDAFEIAMHELIRVVYPTLVDWDVMRDVETAIEGLNATYKSLVADVQETKDRFAHLNKILPSYMKTGIDSVAPNSIDVTLDKQDTRNYNTLMKFLEQESMDGALLSRLKDLTGSIIYLREKYWKISHKVNIYETRMREVQDLFKEYNEIYNKYLDPKYDI